MARFQASKRIIGKNAIHEEMKQDINIRKMYFFFIKQIKSSDVTISCVAPYL